jgi:hypothetical protein
MEPGAKYITGLPEPVPETREGVVQDALHIFETLKK